MPSVRASRRGQARQGSDRDDGRRRDALRFNAASAVRDIACARAPIGLLAELTHRCPLQCPYCSNPLALERVNTELPTDEWLDGHAQAAELGVLQIAPVRRRADRPPRPRRDRRAGGQGRALHQPHHRRRAADARAAARSLTDAGLDHVQISIQDVDAPPRTPIASPHYQGGQRQEDRGRRLGARARPAADDQCADPSPQHRQRARRSSTRR